MAFKYNGVQPTEIIAIDKSAPTVLDFPTGTQQAEVQVDATMKRSASATFTKQVNYPINPLSEGITIVVNDIALATYNKLVYTETIKDLHNANVYTTWNYYASIGANTINLTQIVTEHIKEDVTHITVRGSFYSATAYNHFDLTVLKYSVKESDLSGEATKASVSSYSKAALDSYVGLVNDGWGGITNANSLAPGAYYYIRVLVTDTNRYGKFCVRFRSYNEQGIIADNIGWGYDGEIIAAIPVWGKPFKLTVTQVQGGDLIVVPMITRIYSPNQNAAIDGGATSIIVNDKNDIVYYGDTVHVRATAIGGYDHYKLRMNVNGAIYTGNVGEILEKDITITGTTNIAFSDIYVPYMHELWTGSYSCQAKNQKVTVNWPVTLPGGVTSVSINVNFSFRGKNVSGTYTVNNSGTNASVYIKYNGVSHTTATISWKNNSQFYFESTANGNPASATISSISCVY